MRIGRGLRDDVKEHLQKSGIATAIYYPVALHQLPPYREPKVECPVAERMVEEVLSLPVGPHVSPEAAKRIAERVRDAVGAGPR